MPVAAHTDSYYAATIDRANAETSVVFPTLRGRVDCDVCVVGGGYTGLSAAIHLTKRGYNVVLLEAARVGWGASGRNGGQAIIGYNAGIGALEQRFGLETAKQFLNMALEGRDIIREHITEFGIQCDFKLGHAGLATDIRQLRAMEREKSVWARCGRDNLILLPESTGVRELVASHNYIGAYIDPDSAHLHPLNLAIGEARGLQQLGGSIYENSPVIRLESSGEPRLYTPAGEVVAKYAVLAGNAYLGNLVPRLQTRVIPVSTFIIATQPLGKERAQAVIRKDYGFTDWRYILDYYRLTSDRRLLFGGRSYYGGKQPRNLAASMHRDMLKVFPQLHDSKVEYAWGGNFALTYSRLPDAGRLPGSNVFYAQGYSGHGITTTHIMGRLLAEVISGTAERFEVFSRIRQVPFPGGKYLRIPAVAVAGWYYQLRDILGASRK